MSAMIPFFSSCSDDDSVNEWDMSYVSLLPADYLRPTPSFTLKHVEEEGIEGSVEFQFMATTQKAVAQDINVNIDATCDGISADKINLTSKTAVIKANATASEPITLSITDWDELETNSVAGTGSSDVATNGIPFWLTVDLKTVKTLTGIQTRHWGAGYAPTKVEIFTSEDGEKWVSIGQWTTKGGTQTITFEESVKTRYLKYQMITVPGRVDITRFYIYSWE